MMVCVKCCEPVEDSDLDSHECKVPLKKDSVE